MSGGDQAADSTSWVQRGESECLSPLSARAQRLYQHHLSYISTSAD